MRTANATKIRWLLIGLAVIALFFAGRSLAFEEWLAKFGAWIAGLGPAGYVLYAAAMVLVTILMLPAFLMTVGAGYLFGVPLGMGIAFVGVTIGAAAAFLIARYLARERVERAASRDRRFAALDRAIAEKGWRIVILLRMSAVVPFVLSNYVYGLTGLRFRQYIGASAVGMVPLLFLFTSLGAAARRAGQSEPLAIPDTQTWSWIVLGAGLLLTAGVTVYVARLTRRILREGSTQ
jgi:uncharacterized membrane protein YdjX (TVP38/TMEM64 family)